LGVFDAITAVARAIGFADCFEDVEGDTIGTVADSMKIKLKPGFIALDSHLAEFVGLHDEDAADGRIVGVRSEHDGSARAERAIGDHFQRAGFEPGITGAALSAHIQKVVERGGERKPFGDADGELPFLLQLLISNVIFPLGIVLNGSDAIFGEFGEDEFDAAAAAFFGGIRNSLRDEFNRGAFFQHAGGFAVRVVFNLAAGRVGSVLVDFRALESERVGDGNVAGNVRENDRIFWRDGVELLAIGKFLVGPKRVIPAGASDPLAGPVMGHSFRKTLLHFLDGIGAAKLHGNHALGGVSQMHVSVIEARHYERAL
jgi:hypothetical protein